LNSDVRASIRWASFLLLSSGQKCHKLFASDAQLEPKDSLDCRKYDRFAENSWIGPLGRGKSFAMQQSSVKRCWQWPSSLYASSRGVSCDA
jgi:hypothetical protein